MSHIVGIGTATPSQVLSNATFTSGSGANQSGTIPVVAGGNTITPGTGTVTAIASGTYATSAITVKGDTNLVAANVLSGKSIFGVAGSVIAGTPYASGTSPGSGNNTFTISGLSFTPTRVTLTGSGSAGSSGYSNFFDSGYSPSNLYYGDGSLPCTITYNSGGFTVTLSSNTWNSGATIYWQAHA